MESDVRVGSPSQLEVLPELLGRQDAAAEPCPRAATQEECRPTQQALGDARARLMQLDETLAMSLARGDVRLLSLQWLMKERPKKLLRRQELEKEYKGRAHLPPRQAAALLRSGKRRVLSVSFGWRTPGDPDPTGDMLHDVLVFLDIFIEKHGITAAELAKYGIFWDFGSLCQKPRSDTEDKAFERSLNIMAQLYSSAIGTCVLRYSLIPPRPQKYDRSIAVFFREGPDALDKWMKRMTLNGSAEPVSISDKHGASESHDAEDKWKKHLPLSGSVESISITECGTAIVQYASHQDAESAVATLKQCGVDEDLSGCLFAGACLQWNDRELCDRGWPTLELSVALEVMQRAKMKGFEAAMAVMEDVPIPKLYDITVCTAPEVVRGEERPQPPQEVERRIQNAYFTSSADKEKVIDLYRAHRDETFDKMNAVSRYYLQWDNSVVDMQDERNRFGGACVLSSRPLVRKSAEEVQRLQRRAERLSRNLSRAAHAVPVGLVQLADYASDISVLARWARDEDRQMEFEVGLVFVCLSIGAVWGLFAFAIYIERVQGRGFKSTLPWVATMALAPFNLHVLCLGMMPDDWLGALDEAGMRPLFFWLCKMLETGLESVPLSILTIAVLFDSQEGEDGLLWSSLGLSALSMAYGFYGMCAYSQATEGRREFTGWGEPSNDRVQGCRFSTFLAILVHIIWTLAALGVCWGSRDSLGSLSVILPAALLCTVFVSLVFGILIKELMGTDFNSRNSTECYKLADCFSWLFIVLCSVPLSIEAMAVDLAIFMAPATEDKVMDGTLWLDFPNNVLPVAIVRLLPVFRRVQLVVMATAAVVASWPVPAHCAILGSLQAADLVASTWLWGRLRLIKLPPWPFTKQELLPDVCLRDIPSAEAEEVEPEATAQLREAAARDGYLGLLDMLDGVVNTMGVPNSQSSLLAQEVSLVHELHLLCVELRGSLAELEPAGRGVVTAALAAYLPSSDGRSEGALLRALVPYAPSGSRFVDVLEALWTEHGAEAADIEIAGSAVEKAKAPKCPTGEDHLMEWRTCGYQVYVCDRCQRGGAGVHWYCPLHGRHFCDNECAGFGAALPSAPSKLAPQQAAMRGVSLAFALQRQVWTGTQTMLGGRKGLDSFYDLSAEVARADYYISHAPGDDGSVKLRMLRAYLCIQPLIGTATVVELVLAIVLASLGFAIQEKSKGFPWWILCAASIACYFCILAWIFFSLLGLMPFFATPWALTPFTLWVDICCVDSSTPEAIQLAVQSFPSFVDHSDRMIVFASSEYFGNLRCVFELAAFCYSDFAGLDDKLVMLSTGWRNSCHPCGSEKLTDEEQAWLRTFRCRTARCVKPADRAMLLEQIRETWGSEESFEKFVSTKLPAVFQRSKTQYRRRAMTIALRSCEHVFGD